MIPRLLHHVWPGEDAFRPDFHEFRHSFARHHPDWTLHFWRTNLGPGAAREVQALLDDARYTVVVKSDVARYELLRQGTRTEQVAEARDEALRPLASAVRDAVPAAFNAVPR